MPAQFVTVLVRLTGKPQGATKKPLETTAFSIELAEPLGMLGIIRNHIRFGWAQWQR